MLLLLAGATADQWFPGDVLLRRGARIHGSALVDGLPDPLDFDMYLPYSATWKSVPLVLFLGDHPRSDEDADYDDSGAVLEALTAVADAAPVDRPFALLVPSNEWWQAVDGGATLATLVRACRKESHAYRSFVAVGAGAGGLAARRLACSVTNCEVVGSLVGTTAADCPATISTFAIRASLGYADPREWNGTECPTPARLLYIDGGSWADGATYACNEALHARLVAENVAHEYVANIYGDLTLRFSSFVAKAMAVAWRGT